MQNYVVARSVQQHTCGEDCMNGQGNWVSGPLTHLVDEAGRAAHSGWGQTIRLLVLLIAIGVLATLVLIASRYGVAAIFYS